MSQLTALDLTIITDTLRGSLCVSDDGSIWSYTAEARKELNKRFEMLYS